MKPYNDSIEAYEDQEAKIQTLRARVRKLERGLKTLSNDFRAILDGDDMSGMSDRELFGTMLKTASAALRRKG